MNAKRQKNIVLGFILVCTVVLSFVVGMNIKSNNDSQNLLEESIKSQLISIAVAAKEIIDVDKFIECNTIGDSRNNITYTTELARLRTLAHNVDAKFIYALKKIEDEYIFIYDSDHTEENQNFKPYRIEQVHADAFNGMMSAGIMNLQDAFGNFSTGAVPIIKDGQVVGIVAVDIPDSQIQKSLGQFKINTVMLVSVLAAMLVIVGILLIKLLGSINGMQKELEHMAKFDRLTKLPNRQYLIEYLEDLTSKKNPDPFTLFFIDLDNFKKVNDNAGHDVGDLLLQHIAGFLQSASESSQVFRPMSGSLNVAARIGGDEFLIVSQDLSTADEAAAFADELLQGFKNEGIDKYIDKYEVGMSIGAALFPTDTKNFHVLIKYADIAMYHAKRAGKNRYMLYSEEMKHKEER